MQSQEITAGGGGEPPEGGEGTQGCQQSTASTPVRIGAVRLTQETSMTVIIKILDARSHLWNLGSECLGEAALMLIGTCLVLTKYSRLTFSPPCPAACSGNYHFDLLLPEEHGSELRSREHRAAHRPGQDSIQASTVWLTPQPSSQ